MFTGIIETLGIIKEIQKEQGNLHITVASEITHELKIDQSVAHNGICLTVVKINQNEYIVTAIQETINKTAIGNWQVGDVLNLERAMKLGDRLDGHIVQGHVDSTAVCSEAITKDGSWEYRFEIDAAFASLIIEKGSITINGTSLTIFDLTEDSFKVAIIPYTYHHTNISSVQVGSVVNIEFDMIGKYVNRLAMLQQ